LPTQYIGERERRGRRFDECFIAWMSAAEMDRKVRQPQSPAPCQPQQQQLLLQSESESEIIIMSVVVYELFGWLDDKGGEFREERERESLELCEVWW